MSTLLALNQLGEKLALSQCVNFYQINSLSYDSIEPIDFFIAGINESDLFPFADSSFSLAYWRLVIRLQVNLSSKYGRNPYVWKI